MRDRESGVTMFEGISTTEKGRSRRRATAPSAASASIPTIVFREVNVPAQAVPVVLRRVRAGNSGRGMVRVGYCGHEAYPEYALWREPLTTIRVGSGAATQR
jgi:hypothetical protein